MIFKKLTCFIVVFLSFSINAQDPKSFLKAYEQGEYQEAIDVLTTLNDLPIGHKSFLLGKSYSRLRKYDIAAIYFKQAIQEKYNGLDIYYEYGQALYANNELRAARAAFIKAIVNNESNYIAAIYYVAYISELLDDVALAKMNYRKIIKDPRADKKILQVSLFQYAKILLKMMRENEKVENFEKSVINLDITLTNYIPKYIFPLLIKAKEVDSTSPLVKDIDQLIHDLQEEFKLGPNTMANGRRISADRSYTHLSQGVKYDSDIAYTKKSSLIFETEAFTKYDIVAKRKAILSPELRVVYLKHSDQKDSDIFENDSITFSPGLKNKFEHTYKKLPASFLIDLEYNVVYTDWQSQHRQKKYSTDYSLGVGEQLTLSQLGDTYFRVSSSKYKNESGLLAYKTLSLSADQYMLFGEGHHLVIWTFDYSKYEYDESPLSNYSTYLARAIYLGFEIVPAYTFQFVLTGRITDTKKQKETRGIEFYYAPSFDISKSISKNIRIGVNYTYVQTFSKQEEYKYTKNILGTELTYAF